MDKPVIDVLWVLVSAGLVFVMQAGFLCLEAGMTRTKNSINVAIKNVADFGLSMTLFWLFGFALMFGISRGGWIGASDFLLPFSDVSPWHTTFFLFQAVFCGTAVTIVSGAVAERVRFGGYLAMAFVVAAVIYPIFGHWAWGGAYQGQLGWLAKLGFVDFAGSTVVHSVGGWASLAACIVIGPRLGRFVNGKPAKEAPGSNLPFAMLGAMLLWFGWIGFNGGSTLALDGRVPFIVANTMLAAAAGMVVYMFVGWAVQGYPHHSAVVNGTLAGLVAITANCHVVSAAEAAIIGGIGAMVCFGVQHLLLRWHIDDVVGAVPVHLGAGIWGTIAVAIFGNVESINTGLGRGEQMLIQLLGVLTCGVLTFGVCLPLFFIMNKIWGLRVTEAQEVQGLNFAEHQATTEWMDFATTIDQQARTQDLSIRAPVESFTEVGLVAQRYNQLMDLLQQSTTDIEDLKATQTLLEEAREAAEMANMAKSEFLANMSHEIRTPLHGILSFAGFGLKKAHSAEPEKLEDFFRKIDASGRRLLILVNDLLDLAKLEAGRMTFEFERADLTMVIAGVVDEFASLLSERNVSIAFRKPEHPIFAEVDQLKLMQVVRNLVNNAIKFSPAGSRIDVSLSRNDEVAVVSVRDRGVGVPENELEAIFDKFVQSSKTKSGAGGTGLGLSICREIIKGHQGRIWAENSPDGGAIFTMQVPMGRRAGEETTAITEPIARPQVSPVIAG